MDGIGGGPMEGIRFAKRMEKGKYIFYEKLGSGGSGTVYRAYDKHLKCDRAVKKFPGGGEVWKKELDMLKELRHPLLPVITDSIEDGEDRYLVMEYIEGKNLEAYVKEKGRIGQEQAVGWILDLAEALIYLHERNSPVIYRDMKPANIMVDHNGNLKLVDFGTAWMRYRREDGCFSAGTYGYAAPEQFAAEGVDGVDERSDIYGLGVTLYYMLTGNDPSKPPFLIHPIRFFDRKFPAGLERAVEKAAAAEKGKRYQTVRQFQAVLKKYRRKNRIQEQAGKMAEGVYYGALFVSCVWFARMCGMYGKEKEILTAAAAIIGLCLARTAAGACMGWGRRGIRQERSLLLTEKKGKGLPLLFAALLSAAIVGAVQTFAFAGTVLASAGEENKLRVDVRNGEGQKLLIRYDAVYPLSDVLKLELPLSNFREGETYRLRLECTNCETEEMHSRTFYLKGLEP